MPRRRIETNRRVISIVGSLFLSLLILFGLELSADAEDAGLLTPTENTTQQGQDVADKIAFIAKRAVYNLDSDQLMAVVENYLDENPQIKSLRIVENIDQEVLLTFYRLKNRSIYNQPIPDVLLKPDVL